MKKALYILAIATAVISTSNCSRMDEFGKKTTKHRTYTAEIIGDTRTSLSEDGDVYHVNWNAGDLIAINDGTNTSYYKANEGGKNTSTFTFAHGVDPDGLPVAYYPSTAVNELPAVQEYTAGNIARSPMVGTIEEDHISFKNLCGIVKFNVSTTGKSMSIKTIEISADQPLSGEYVVDNGTAVIGYGNQGITINCTKGFSLSSTPTPLYVALPEGKYTNMTFKVTAANRSTCTVKMKRGQSITVERSKVHEGAIQFNNFKDAPKLPVADLFDILFNADGTAIDISSSCLDVQTVDGTAMTTFYDAALGRYVAHFNHNGSMTISSGFYRADYDDNIADALSNGHSLECLFCLDFTSPGTTEYKMFSAMQSGGTGFLVSKSTANPPLQLTFLPYVGSNYIWTGGDINPEGGHYYHVVGVYDKDEEETRIYIDGEFMNAYEATGAFKNPSAAARWFCVGGDASNTAVCQSGWKGDVAIARAYSKALTDDEVKALYEASYVGRDYSNFFYVQNISFASDITVSVGEEYVISASEIEEGDYICFESVADDKLLECVSNYDSGMLKAVIPAGMTSGTYRIWLCRGEQRYSLGKTILTIL